MAWIGPAARGPGQQHSACQLVVAFSFAAISVYSWFKAVVFALLTLNSAFYVYSGTTSEGLDSVAWLLLLALFELETAVAATRTWATVIRGVRLAAAAAIPLAAIGYFLGGEWLDVINSALWIAVVVVLELQVRVPATAMRYGAWSSAVLAALYAGLGTLAAVWLWRAEWFAGYDALLWLLAFVTIEIDVLHALQSRLAAVSRKPQSARMAG